MKCRVIRISCTLRRRNYFQPVRFRRFAAHLFDARVPVARDAGWPRHHLRPVTASMHATAEFLDDLPQVVGVLIDNLAGLL